MTRDVTKAFFDFIGEREAIRLRKEADPFAGPPWTEDPILAAYKFTNVRRFHDRTTTELRNRFYGPNRDDDRRAILMNCALFRYFGTWEFAAAVGWQSYDDFQFDWIRELARQRLNEKKRVFTGAYVITNQGIADAKENVVVDIFLRGLHAATPELLRVVQMTRNWEPVSREMMKIIGFGGTGFMTKEILLDTMMTNFWLDSADQDGYPLTLPSDYDTWTPIGPGALRGASRILGHDNPVLLKPRMAADVIERLCSIQTKFWDTRKLGVLYPADIQFQLCEFDKYERVRLGQGRPRSRYRP